MFLIICGPTASGKSALAVQTAIKRNGEIISADSMQVYKGMDIGTAKITEPEMRGVPHHLLSFVDPKIPYTAAAFKKDCERCMDDIKARGKFPIICGGTGLYIDAVINGLFEEPETFKAELREEFNSMLETHGLAHMVELLRAKDPEIIDEIDIKNPRRVLRCLEIIGASGEKASVMRAKAKETAYQDEYEIIVLNPPREELALRINERVDKMFASGLVEEVKSLLESGVPASASSMQGIGYKEVAEHILAGTMLADTAEKVKQNTRAYAKRQVTWFKKYLKDIQS